MEKENPLCEEAYVYEDAVGRVRKQMPPEEQLFSLAVFYKAFADSTRVRILYALDRQELCVCDIAELLGMTVSAVSHQLRVLRGARLVRYRRDGKTIFYSLADEHVKQIIECGMEHICEKTEAEK